MLVEFTGCTGAGKTTLVRQTIRILQCRGVTVLHNQPFMPRWRLAQTGSNLYWDVQAKWRLIKNNKEYKDFIAFCRHAISKLPCSRFLRANLLRGVVRKVGMYDYLKEKACDGGLALLDEGTVHAAHNIFVHPLVQADDEDVDAFVACVPISDVTINVETAEDVLLERIQRRSDPPGRQRTEPDSARFVKEARRVFQKLSGSERFRMISINVDRDGEDAGKKAVNAIFKAM